MNWQLAVLALLLSVECSPYRGNHYIRWKTAQGYISTYTQQKLDNLYASLTSDLSGRIIGGRNAKLGEVPYQLRLEVTLPQNMLRRCGAALTEYNGVQFAITAAHCVLGEDQRRITTISRDKVSIIAGDHAITVSNSEQYRTPSKIVIHPQYEGAMRRSPQNDIAIMFYSRPFTINKNVATIPLPQSNWERPQKAFISGWGSTTSIYTNTRRSDILKVVWVKTISTQACKSHQFDAKLITSNQLCLLEANKGPCKGDSGGPAAGTDPSTGTWYLVGIGNYVQADCGEALPSVYARVTAYVNWIQTTVNGNRRRRG